MSFDFNKYNDAFFSEAKSLIEVMNSTLMKLEKNPNQPKLLHNIYCAVHTLKSLSGTMNYQNTMELCHAMEDLLETLRKDPTKISQCTDILFKCFDFLNSNLSSLESKKGELDSSQLIMELKYLITNGNHIDNNVNPSEPEVKLEKIKAIEVKVERMDVLINLVEELLVNKMRFDVIREENSEHTELATAVESLGRLITELQYHVMQIRLVPIEFIFQRFQRMARDLAKKQKKEVKLEIVGGDIEIDRLLIDEINESIAHLIRNAIDHGIETPAVRQKMNKPREGTITLYATRSKESVSIEIKDDGAGLNLPLIKNIAIEQGLVGSNIKDEKLIDLIFTDLSTTPVVTEVSGRGLGLGIVKQKVESIGGNIHVKSEMGKGTSFIMEVPFSLAIIRTLFVKVGEEIYAIPIEAVERLLIVAPEDFKGLIKNEAVVLGNNNIPIVRLSELFHVPPKVQAKQPIVVIQKGGERLGLVVDSLLSTHEVAIKPLVRVVRNSKYFSGAALIGSGEMVLILDTVYLLQANTPSHAVEKI